MYYLCGVRKCKSCLHPWCIFKLGFLSQINIIHPINISPEYWSDINYLGTLSHFLNSDTQRINWVVFWFGWFICKSCWQWDSSVRTLQWFCYWIVFVDTSLFRPYFHSCGPDNVPIPWLVYSCLVVYLVHVHCANTEDGMLLWESCNGPVHVFMCFKPN